MTRLHDEATRESANLRQREDANAAAVASVAGRVEATLSITLGVGVIDNGVCRARLSGKRPAVA